MFNPRLIITHLSVEIARINVNQDPTKIENDHIWIWHSKFKSLLLQLKS